MKPCYAFGLLLALAVGYVSLSEGQQPVLPPIVAEPTVQMWEYKTLDYDEGTLNTAGREGWEAYAVTIATNNARVVYLRRPNH
jgi:hypothetical protein